MRETRDRVHSQLLSQLNGNDVARLRQRVTKRERTQVLAVGVFGTIDRSVWKVDHERGVLKDRVRCDAVGDCRSIDDRLERGPGLTHSVDRAVKMRVAIVPPTYKRANIPGGWIQRDYHSLQVVGSRPSAGAGILALNELGMGVVGL